MGRITKTLIAGTAAVGLLYVGGRYNLDDKIRDVYEAGKQEVKEMLQEYKSRFSNADNMDWHYPLTPAEIAYQKKVDMSMTSAYVVAQTPPVQRQIIENIYRNLSQTTLVRVVVAGFYQLSDDNEVTFIEHFERVTVPSDDPSPTQIMTMAHKTNVDMSMASAYVVAQTPPVQTQIIEDIYRGLSQATLVQVVVAGYDQLFYSNQLEVIEKLVEGEFGESIVTYDLGWSSDCDPAFNIEECR